jgi:hypothetical protein
MEKLRGNSFAKTFRSSCTLAVFRNIYDKHFSLFNGAVGQKTYLVGSTQLRHSLDEYELVESLPVRSRAPRDLLLRHLKFHHDL